MDRRNALKSLGMSLGYVVATPTLISIVQSCKEENVLEWNPDFFTKEEGAVISRLVDIILPKTDTPSATEVQVDVFIDRFADQVMKTEQQDFVKMTMGKFLDKALKDSGKEDLTDLKPEDLEPVLATSLKISKDRQEENKKAIEDFMASKAKGGDPKLSDDISRFAFSENLRGITILGYKTSEYIGEKVLAYLPVPGEYVSCGNTDELSGGKAWSL